MKRVLCASALLILCVSVACKKAKGPANGNSYQENNQLDSTVHINCNVNGVLWQTDSAFAYIVKQSGNDSSANNLMISAINYTAPLTSIVFNISNYTGPATYPVDPPFNTIIYYQGNTRHFATVGQIIIAADTAYALRGTFAFTADSIDATNGVYDVAKP